MTMPSIGRTVHYVSRGSADGVFPPACRMALVTEVGADARVGLAVVNPDGLFFHPLSKDGGIEYRADEQTPGSWHWPERV